MIRLLLCAYYCAYYWTCYSIHWTWNWLSSHDIYFRIRVDFELWEVLRRLRWSRAEISWSSWPRACLERRRVDLESRRTRFVNLRPSCSRPAPDYLARFLVLSTYRLRFVNSESDHYDRRMWWFEISRNKRLIFLLDDSIISSNLKTQELFCEFYLCVLKAMLSIDTMIYWSKFDLKWIRIKLFKKMNFFASFVSIILNSWRRRKK